MPLERLGPFQLEKVLGRGGMGSVYAGVNEETGQRAAVKVLSPALADDANFRERFKSEVETLKKLLHPNIVRLHGFGEEDDHLYYVMELINGRSLQDELTAGRRFTWREVARIGVEIAKALKHAHDRGVVHRDLKPANLLVDENEQVKLTDFGIAKLYGGTNITSDGGVLGTADYMAPEQAEGKQITSRCDLYSLGCVMHALLAGRPPFTGKSVLEVIQQLRFEKPTPVRRLAPDVPEEFETIILQLLEKDPYRRIPTAVAVGNRLRAMEHALSLETRVGVPADDELRLAPDDLSIHSAATGVELAQRVTAPLPEGGLQGADSPTIVTGPGAEVTPAPLSTAESPGGLKREEARPNALKQLAPRPAHFTTVSEAELRGATEPAADDSAAQWIKIGLLGLAVMALIGTIVYLATRPPTADELYERIVSAAASDDPQAVVHVDDDIGQFLALYGDDPRIDELQTYRQDIDLYRLQRRFELRMRRASQAEGLSPVERAYADALGFMAADPQEALARFEAIVAVYGGDTGSEESALQQKRDAQCVELAKKQIERLSKAATQAAEEQKTLLASQLARANDLAETDPAAARAIWQGIVTLYADKPWAESLVAEARAKLERRED